MVATILLSGGNYLVGFCSGRNRCIGHYLVDGELSGCKSCFHESCEKFTLRIKKTSEKRPHRNCKSLLALQLVKRLFFNPPIDDFDLIKKFFQITVMFSLQSSLHKEYGNERIQTSCTSGQGKYVQTGYGLTQEQRGSQ